MSLLILGFGHVIDNHDVLIAYGCEGCYTIPNADGSYTPPYGTGDMEMDDATNAMSGLTMGAAGYAAAGYAAAGGCGSAEGISAATGVTASTTVFDDYRIVGKTVINLRLTNLIGTPIYMTTYRCDSDATLACAFTFEPPFISRTCFYRTEPVATAAKPAHVTADQIALLGSLLSVSTPAAPFLFHGMLDMLD